MYQKWMKILMKCALFQGIAAGELLEMLNCLNPKLKNYKKRKNIITIEGERFTEIGVVLDGEVAVTKENAEGTRVIMTKLGEGELFGEIIAFSRERVWPATVITSQPCLIMFVPVAKIVDSCTKRCSSHQQLIVNMLKIVSNRALMLNRKVNYLTIKSLRGKISTFLLEQYKKSGQKTFMLPLKRQECAEFLNVSRPALSREMCRMRDEGMIEFHLETIKIIDLEALKRARE